MKLYKPIDGLLEPRARRGRPWAWALAVVALVAGVVAIVAFTGGGDEEDDGPAAPAAPRASSVLAGLEAEPPPIPLEPAPGAVPTPVVQPAPVPSPTPEPAAPVLVAKEPVEAEAKAAPEADKPVDAAPERKLLDPIAAAKTPPKVKSGQVLPGKAGSFEGKIASGQSLYLALSGRAFSAKQITPAINALGKKVDFRKTRPGHRWAVQYNETGRITQLDYQPGAETVHYVVFKPGKGYEVKQRRVPVETRIHAIGGTVRSSVYKALRDMGEDHGVIRTFIDVFQYDIDFAAESKPGDTFRLAYEKVYVDGKFLRNGRLLAAEYVGKGKSLRGYYAEEHGAYFEKSGQSLRRMFLKNPVPFSRITSKFGKRFHPVLKKWAQHNGVDYAAPRGTEIHAIAGGTVTFAGKKGANGNLIAIKHPNAMTSYYSHQSRFAKGLKVGNKVKQGQLIGYVGSTGRSTGPHLHLAIRTGAGFIDPLSVKSTRGMQLQKGSLVRFRAHVRKLDKKLNGTKISPPSKAPPEPEPVGGDDLADSMGDH
jgi:murein DD-endopeptidase MepM/ murein hydrolase activator NlpD